MFGPQGSGKGTQSALLAEYLHIQHISTGELFRNAIQNATPLGKAIAADMKSGKLVTDDSVNKLVREEFQRRILFDGYILDGYPRTLVQTEYLETLAAPSMAIVLELTDDDAVLRIAGRLVCSGCGATYHLTAKKPAVANVCDNCGGVLHMREDDNEQAVRARLALYHKETEPLLSYYDNQHKLVRVDAAPAVDVVAASIRSALKV